MADNIPKRYKILKPTIITFVTCITFFGLTSYGIYSESMSTDKQSLIFGAILFSILVSSLVFVGSYILKTISMRAEKTQTMTLATTKDIKPLFFTLFLWIIFVFSLVLFFLYICDFFFGSNKKGDVNPIIMIYMLSMFSSLSLLILRNEKIMINNLSLKKTLRNLSMRIFIPSVTFLLFLTLISLAMMGG